MNRWAMVFRPSGLGGRGAGPATTVMHPGPVDERFTRLAFSGHCRKERKKKKKGNRTPALSILSASFVSCGHHFKELAKETGIPYQNLINPYLRECVHAGKKPALSWTAGS